MRLLFVGIHKDPVSGKTIQKGAQIDLLIDRNDDTINLCEMKYTNAPYTITEEEDEKSGTERKPSFVRQKQKRQYLSR